MNKMRYWFEYVALLSLLGIFKVMGLDRASRTGGAIFRAVGPRMGVHRLALHNIQRAFPDMSAEQVKQTALMMWDNLGRVVAEYPHLEQIGRERVKVLNPELLPAPNEHGVIFVSGHMANWEAFPQGLLSQFGIGINPVYRAPNNPYVDKMLLEYRSAGGALQSFGKSKRGLTQILRALQSGKSIGMLIDQKMNTGIKVPFFDRPAMTATAFVELARKVKGRIVPGNIVRKNGAYFEVTLEPDIAYEGRETFDAVLEMHEILERWITANPAQWLWTHKRWAD